MVSSALVCAQPIRLDGAHVVETSTGITVNVEAGGRYAITVQDSDWRFGGDIGSPLTDIEVNQGTDNIGDFQEIVFNYTVGASPSQGTRAEAARQGGIRTYRGKPVLLFADSRQ
jgi:hypothetical protein